MKITKQVVIIGGGPAGLAAAVALYDQGVHDILIIEREKHLGGILRQCIHDGFGLTRFRETLSGPEYAERFIQEVEKRKIPYITESTVIELTEDKMIRATTREGIVTYEAEAVVLAMGCRERTRGALQIPGERPSGVYTAGVAQSYINLYNTMVGKEVIILGSGDIGLIMARRLTIEGAKVLGVYEILPYPSGLDRNISQCLDDYGIPLHLSHTVTKIHGSSRIEGVTISKVDKNRCSIEGSEVYHSCDTLILSVGLIPENELSKMAGVEIDPRTNGPVVDLNYETTTPNIFAAGNVLHVHDLVDYVSLESERMACSIASALSSKKVKDLSVEVKTGNGIGYVVPQKITENNMKLTLSMRVRKPDENIKVIASQDGTIIASKVLEEALPAEMIHLKIDSSKLLNHIPVEVSVE